MNSRLSDISFGLLTAVLRAMARLPLGALYVCADAVAWLMRHVVRYRRRLVRQNLAACFPEKSDAELRDIEKRFYRNFADNIVETVKLLHISDAEMSRRMTWSGLDVMQKIMDRGQSVTAYFAHTGNWEWVTSLSLAMQPQIERGCRLCQIYRPLKNRHFDALMLKLRSRFGTHSIAKAHTLREFVEMRRDGVVSVTGFMSDQKPSHGDAIHTVKFLCRETYVITGTETLTRRMGMAAVYFDMRKVSRGHYHVDVRLLSDDVARLEPMALTDRYFACLEQTIRRDPAIWLWSHNRWKKPPNVVAAEKK